MRVYAKDGDRCHRFSLMFEGWGYGNSDSRTRENETEHPISYNHSSPTAFYVFFTR